MNETIMNPLDSPALETFMREAIALGRSVHGQTGDNPNVGCVIVLDGQVIGKGATSPPGGAHAEVHAIQDALQKGYDLAQATLFCTVEPCCFTGRTPPCTEAIRAQNIPQVVIGIRDPHPRVRGRGVEYLQNYGIEVTENICATEVKQYLSDWLQRYE